MVLYMLDNEFNVPIKFSNLGNSFDSIFKKEKVARKITLFYCLQRALTLDGDTTVKILEVVANLKPKQIEEDMWFFNSFFAILGHMISTLTATDNLEVLDSATHTRSSAEKDRQNFIHMVLVTLASHFYGHLNIHKDFQILLVASVTHLSGQFIFNTVKIMLTNLSTITDLQAISQKTRLFLQPNYILLQEKMLLVYRGKEVAFMTSPEALFFYSWLEPLNTPTNPPSISTPINPPTDQQTS
eukprot:TRINITY_DN13441_c1_g2_i15.p1 TRINITY_DN13441_c1_g2~~TRINITY_DN13441_c1_g2_i15.p1  ORF type:complete len:242 (-),score=51.42 TRINITY_DN13441_c1_g2_i15:52-777(-)